MLLREVVDGLNIELGDPVIFQNMAVRPITGKVGQNLDILVYGDDIASGKPEDGKVYVDEINRMGLGEEHNIKRVGVDNKTGHYVLIPHGTLLVGGDQNRQVLESVLLEHDHKGTIPTKCQEQGRWGRHRYFDSGGASSSVNRFDQDQGRTWASTQSSLFLLGISNETKDHNVILNHDGVKAYTEFFLNAFDVKNLTGLIFAFPDSRGMFVAADIFNNPEIMNGALEGLVRGYAAHANALMLAGDEDKITDDAVQQATARTYLSIMEGNYSISHTNFSVGTRILSETDGINSLGLIYKSSLVHLCAAESRYFTYKVEESERYKEIILPEGKIIFGRSSKETVQEKHPDLQFYIQVNEEGVSREHAEMLVKGKRAVITDMGSKNGTFINGMEVKVPQMLNAGDEISISRVAFFYSPEKGNHILLYRDHNTRRITSNSISAGN